MTLRGGREERNRNWKDDGKKREGRRSEDGRRCERIGRSSEVMGLEREMDEAWISEMGCCVKNYRSRMIFFLCVYEV